MMKKNIGDVLKKLLFWMLLPVVWTYANLVLGWRVTWEGKLPKGPKILVANHPSTIDPFIVALLARSPSRILIKGHLFRIPLFGFYLRQAGHIPVIPGRGSEAFEAAKQLLEAGHTVMLFPEGELSPREGGFQETRTGAARLALVSGAPVIPIGIDLNRKHLRAVPSHIDGEDTVGLFALGGPYRLTVGQPMQFDGSLEDREWVTSVAEVIMQRIIVLSNQSAMQL
jgi:1-acyl-sn-glycerol-3-phosphate acyltransferase